LVTGGTLDPVHDLPGCQGRRDFDEEVDVIWLDGEIQDPPAEIPDDLGDECLQSLTHGTGKYRAPILRAEDEVIPNLVGCVSSMCSFVHSERIITPLEN
jgi:hypothetical protein